MHTHTHTRTQVQDSPSHLSRAPSPRLVYSHHPSSSTPPSAPPPCLAPFVVLLPASPIPCRLTSPSFISNTHPLPLFIPFAPSSFFIYLHCLSSSNYTASSLSPSLSLHSSQSHLTPSFISIFVPLLSLSS